MSTYVGMTRPPKMYSDCMKKKRYRTENKAKEVAARCMVERPGTVLRTYYCPTCLQFHITSKEKTKPKP